MVQPDRAKVCACNDEADIGVKRCMYVCMHVTFVNRCICSWLCDWLWGCHRFCHARYRSVTTCSSLHYHQSLSPRNRHAQTTAVHPDRAKVCAKNGEACIGVLIYVCIHVCMVIYAVVCAIDFGVAIDFVRPVIAVITTCAGIHYHQSLSPCNERAQTKVVHADRAKVYA